MESVWSTLWTRHHRIQHTHYETQVQSRMAALCHLTRMVCGIHAIAFKFCVSRIFLPDVDFPTFCALSSMNFARNLVKASYITQDSGDRFA